jgi:hypothetical protein
MRRREAALQTYAENRLPYADNQNYSEVLQAAQKIAIEYEKSNCYNDLKKCLAR